MTVQLNHTIVWCRDAAASAEFLTGVLGLPPARPFHHFIVVDLDNGVSLDFWSREEPVAAQHYEWTGWSHGKPLITYHFFWKMQAWMRGVGRR